ncbi:MAG TPA: ABC transporter ATP-binding protein [Candidatus Saccharimonadales bacterium]|nr:ABC transporter ATP-binding protein [Candidatus Saccharimonadales bacterium]
MDDAAIKIENLSKTFKLPHEKHTSVKSAFVNFYRRRTFENLQALNDVSFEIKKGEFFGIVGRNGSGKSTLLKLIAGIYAPTKGNATINGSLTPFIELGVGFNPELTGRENVFLNGALLGFTRKEMKAMYKDIVGFAELEKFMDQKLKNYSSGMQVRLAFSIAIRAKSDILLIDEVLAVGDAAFQQKCYDYFENLINGGVTVVLVTHDMTFVKHFCKRAMIINGGKLVMIGDSSKVADKYLELNKSSDSEQDKT